MRFDFEKEELSALPGAESPCWLLTNGLGGYASLSAAFSVTRCDQGLLAAAREAPGRRFVLVHRLSETLTVGGHAASLSAQRFADGRPPEDGLARLLRFTLDRWPEWLYEEGGVRVRRRCALAHGENTAAVLYEVENNAAKPCVLRVTPFFLGAPKGEALGEKPSLRWEGERVRANGQTVYLRTDARLEETAPVWERLAYPDDARDGRPASGWAGSCCAAELRVPAGERGRFELLFSDRPVQVSGEELLSAMAERQRALEERSGLSDPVARQLVVAADAFVARRDSTGGGTIIAGYPLFADWGRDTMIALPGCVLTAGRFETAKSILRTFLAYERDGLVPNLFPEGGAEPLYNTADASLLLINCVWLYFRRTGDAAFVREAWPVLERIVRAYRRGTRHAIFMDTDGLLHAGEGLDQVTWMDVRIGDLLPTPRHGKPVEINAYWYNALCVLRELAPLAGADGGEYGALAERVKAAFNEKFWMEDEGCLWDVLSGTKADSQIRCNQIWAVSLPFTMLPPEREARVVETVYRHLYTPQGLRTLSPEDPEFHPFYGGSQRERDLAYHQGTVWPFPLGAWYLAYLKVRGYSREALRQVREWLSPMACFLREGCVGQLPEIYDGGTPGPSKGCYAQAWSVGELLRVYETLEQEEKTYA